MQTVCINLARCPKRWEAMREAFPGEELTRLEAIDCREWESGQVNRFERPLWKPSAWDRLVKNGTVSSKTIFQLSPGGVANYLSHAKAWQAILWSGEAGAIVLEDDVRPTEYFKGFGSFDPCGKPVVFLYGTKVKANEAGKLTYIQHAMGYYISKEAAKTAIQAMRPMYLNSDMQWFGVAFKDFKVKWNIHDISVEKHDAYVQKDFWLKPSEHAAMSTMTHDGRKPWRE